MSQILLVGTDGSESAGRALDYAAEWAKSVGAKLVVAYVIEWSPYTFSTPSENEVRHKRREEELARATNDVINPVVSKYQEQGIDVEGLVKHGHAASTLKALCGDIGATNLLVGRKGTSKLKSLLYGSVAGTLVQISDCPVTVVP